jgi:HAD superfamily hydrolase (TIGR01509 family)
VQGPQPLRAEALLFDLGGVLIEIEFERALEHWARCAGVPVEAIRSRFHFEQTLGRYECGEIDAAAYFAWLRRALGIQIPDDEFHHGWNAIFGAPVAGIEEVLASLHGRVPMYVFSNTNADHERVWSARYAELLRPFERVFVSHGIRRRKPTPEAFHAVAQAIDAPPERIVFLDDTPANVEGALAVGMHAARARSAAEVKQVISQYQWSNFREETR